MTHQALRTLALLALIAVAAGPAAAQKGVDDSYKGPSTGGGLDGQLRQQQGWGQQPAPQGAYPQRPSAGGAGGGGEGLRGTQRQGTIAPIPIAIPAFLGDDPKLAADV